MDQHDMAIATQTQPKKAEAHQLIGLTNWIYSTESVSTWKPKKGSHFTCKWAFSVLPWQMCHVMQSICCISGVGKVCAPVSRLIFLSFLPTSKKAPWSLPHFSWPSLSFSFVLLEGFFRDPPHLRHRAYPQNRSPWLMSLLSSGKKITTI